VHQRDEFWLGDNTWSRASINAVFELSRAELLPVKKINCFLHDEREIVRVVSRFPSILTPDVL
jgi:hypothetical protein